VKHAEGTLKKNSGIKTLHPIQIILESLNV